MFTHAAHAYMLIYMLSLYIYETMWSLFSCISKDMEKLL